jgi:hypothetical protein
MDRLNRYLIRLRQKISLHNLLVEGDQYEKVHHQDAYFSTLDKDHLGLKARNTAMEWLWEWL